ncbi:hypothetical protein GCM10023185_07000 [Hymenobacter saemangeumensis]|uniref:Phage virion morphogenesis protein n=1 Tax=Hymenobacter saemangeumensis TaxID=1084522 RepID=A0ABP8I2S4_9BACT
MKLDQLRKDAAKMASFLKGAPRVMGQLAVREYVASFKRQGWLNERGVFIPWKARKKEKRNRSGISGRQSFGKGESEGRAVLVKSGRLRRSIRVATVVPGESVTVATDAPYAQVHNQGGLINSVASVRSHRRRRYETDEVSAPGARKAKYVKQQVGTSTVKAHTRKMNTRIPRRQFMGDSAGLTSDIKHYFDTNIKRIFNS